MRRMGILPESRKITRQRKNLLAPGRIRDVAIVLALALVVLLGLGEQPKFFVPVRFQRSGHETIIRATRRKRRRANSAS